MEQPPEPKRQDAAAAAGGSCGPVPVPGPAAAPLPLAAPRPTPDDTSAPAADDGRSSTGSPFARILLPELLQRVSGFMERNEVACSLRLVGRAFAAALPGLRYTTVRLSEPVPPTAFELQWNRPDALRSLNRKQREQLELLTARSGSITNLQTLAARGDLPCLSLSPGGWLPLLKAAARHGRLELCAWLRQQGSPATILVTHAAVESGELALVQSLVDTSSQTDVLCTARAAARHGHVHVLDWLLGRLPPHMVEDVLSDVAHGCSLDVLQRLYTRYLACRQQQRLGPRELEMLLASAGSSPTPDWQEKVEWLEALGCPHSSTACAAAARQPDVRARLQWLVGRGYALDKRVAYAAAEAGNAEALLYLLTEGVEVDAWTAFIAARRAARHGQLSILQVLHAEVGVDVSGRLVEAAAACGHLPVVAWAAELLGDAFELSAGLFRAAARSGSWPLLRWLHERGCPRDASVFGAAVGSCSEEQLEWLVERGCPMGVDGTAYVTAARAQDLNVMCCLRRLGCPFAPDGGTFTMAMQLLQLRDDGIILLRWLLDVGCPVDWPAATRATTVYGSSVVQAWLREQLQQRQGRQAD